MLGEKNKKNFEPKELIITGMIIFICLILSITFPAKGNFQDIIKSLIFLLILPMLYIKLVLKKSAGDFGLNIQNKKTGIIWGGLMLLVSLLAIYAVINYTDFTENYALSSLVVNNFWFFLFHMLIIVNFFLFLQEYFFRGFVLFSFAPIASFWTIFIQAGIYFITILIAKGGFQPEIWTLVPFIIISITGGVTAYKSKSMIYSYLSGLLFLILLNSYLIYAIKTQ